MKIKRKGFIVLLSVCVLMSSSSMAKAASATRVVTGNSQYGITATATSYSAPTKIFTVISAQHTYGIKTTVSAGKSVTKTSSSSATVTGTVGASYAGASMSAALAIGNSESASVTVSSGVAYEIPTTVPSGMYRIETVFPQNKVNFLVVKSTSSGKTTLKNATISSMPRAEDAYYRLYRYSDVVIH